MVNGSITDSATANALNPSNTPVSSTPASTTVSATTGLHITTMTLTPGEKGVAYKVKLAATGGTAPYTWSLKTGPLPPGLTLSTNGKLAGTPTKKGTYTLTFRVADSASPKGKATATLTLHISQVVVTERQKPAGTDCGRPAGFSNSGDGVGSGHGRRRAAADAGRVLVQDAAPARAARKTGMRRSVFCWYSV